jgi:hypothetical protein
MRLWSIHPSYLDAKGLVALWREGLLARKVLEGKTKGYTNHPQLVRFKNYKNPLVAIDMYLEEVFNDAIVRGYSFDSSKILLGQKAECILVTDGQLVHELEHLKKKLEVRDPKKLASLLNIKNIRSHPLFEVIKGEIEEWERVSEDV